MTAIVMSCVTNWENDPELGEQFEDDFQYVKAIVEDTAESVPHKGDLVTLYIQMQFDCEGMPNAVSGFKIGRYSTKHKDLQCVIEVSSAAFQAQAQKRAYLLSRVKGLLFEIEKRLQDRTRNNVGDIVSGFGDSLLSS